MSPRRSLPARALTFLFAGWLFIAAAANAQESPAQELPPRVPAPRLADPDRPQAEDVYTRTRWFLQGRNAPDAAQRLQQAYELRMAQRAARAMDAQRGVAQSAASIPSVSWTSIGPAPMISDANGNGFQDYGNVTGRVTAIAVDPNDATGNTVYVGGAYGGVWKSTNAANATASSVTWTSLFDDQPSLSIGAIAVQPGNANVVLVGTGEPNFGLDSYYGLGVLRSTDGGLTWSLISSADGGTKPFRGFGFARIVFSATNSNLVVAAVSGQTLGPTVGAELNVFSRGMFYSTDAGATWHQATVSGSTSVTVDATDVAFNATAGKFFAALRLHGIYSSSDGVTWTRLATQPAAELSTLNCPNNAVSASCPFGRGQVAVRPGATNEMYVWYVDDSANDHGIYQTFDGGSTWHAIDVSGIDNCGDTTSGLPGCGTTQGEFNLALAAVPNGTGTVVYAGAVNIYKCQIAAGTSACGGGWLNITHVYGCDPTQLAEPSHVHPDQHAIDFLKTQSLVVFFGNDGGLYRTTNGTASATGGCTPPNPFPFDNLNQNLGSLTEFVTMAQNPADASSLLGGTQDNGSPAIDSTHAGANGTTWTESNLGDGSYLGIDPISSSTWYTSNPGGISYICGKGINCKAFDWIPAVTWQTLANDLGAFYTPLMLDPAASSQMIVGTCRVWRGPANGAGWGAGTANALSNNFDTGNALTCQGIEHNLVRALAAGGPTTAAGAEVIYAGTFAGRVFVTTHASGGPSTWVDRTGFSTGGAPVSSIAIDTTDATGNTAYLTVMSFGVGHVYKTTSAGASWTNISVSGSGFPDVPANSVAIDPVDHTIIYVGTDAGVWATSNGGATWSEYGPATHPGNLPNVPVMKLATFNDSTHHLLRAATYGRGVWQTTLASGAGSIAPQTGWWGDVNPQNGKAVGLNGIGFFVEQNPATTGIFMAGFLYDSGGTATWLVTTGPTSGSTYTGNWLKVTGGQTLLGAYKAPTSQTPSGSIVLTFTSPTTATLTRPDNTVIPLFRFSFTTLPIPPPVAGAPQIGWWWADPNGPGAGTRYGSGTGYGIEIQGTSVFIVAYVYDSLGNPIWYLATGSLSSPTSYTGSWGQYGGGPQLTSPEGTYSASVVNPSVSAMTLTFSDATHATLTMGAVTIPLVRFGNF